MDTQPSRNVVLSRTLAAVVAVAVCIWTSEASARQPLESVAKSDREETVTLPVPVTCKLSSPFGWRMGRTGKARMFHAAVDFAASMGTPVFATRRGVVAFVAKEGKHCQGFCGYGNAVVVYHPDQDVWTLYGHLSKIDVDLGEDVKAGQRLGAVGATSNGRFKGMGAHLHFEVRQRLDSGSEPYPGLPRAGAVDPQKWLKSCGIAFDDKGYAVNKKE